MINKENVKVVKFLTDEILAEVEFNGDEYTIKNPVMLEMEPNEETGHIALRMYPWLHLTNETEFTIAKIHVITTAAPLPKLAEGYITQHSNIAVPSGLVIPS